MVRRNRTGKGKKTGSFDIWEFPGLGCLECNRDLRQWRAVALGCQGIVGVDYCGQTVEWIDCVLEEVE